MEEGAMGMSGVGWIGMIIIGIIAGWIAEKVTKSDHGLLTNLLVGVIGALIGGWLASLLGIAFGGFLGTLIIATIGAILFLLIWQAIRRRT